MSKDPKSVSHASLVGLWMIATASGSAVALLTSQGLLVALGRVAWPAFDEVLVGGLLGLLMGVGQWLVIRRQLVRSGWWVAGSLVGGVALGLVASQAGSLASAAAATGAYGIILGASQWPVLRGRARGAGWWIPVCGAAWVVGSRAMLWVDSWAMRPSWPLGEMATVVLMYAVLGSVVGALTGGFLAWAIQPGEHAPGPSVRRVAA